MSERSLEFPASDCAKRDLVASEGNFNAVKPKGITEADRVVPRVGVQIDPARQPDGILRQEGPIAGILPTTSPRTGFTQLLKGLSVEAVRHWPECGHIGACR